MHTWKRMLSTMMLLSTAIVCRLPLEKSYVKLPICLGSTPDRCSKAGSQLPRLRENRKPSDSQPTCAVKALMSACNVTMMMCTFLSDRHVWVLGNIVGISQHSSLLSKREDAVHKIPALEGHQHTLRRRTFKDYEQGIQGKESHHCDVTGSAAEIICDGRGHMLICQRCGDYWLPQVDDDLALAAVQRQAFSRDRASRCQHKLRRARQGSERLPS